MGRALLPSPFLGNLLATLVIDAAGSPAQKAEWLPAIAAGDLKATLATMEGEGAWDLDAVGATAKAEGGRVVLEGSKVLVPDAPSAELVIGTFREEAFQGVALDAGARLGDAGCGLEALERVMQRVWTALAAEMAGGAERALQITVDYAKAREQFGKPIGAFQAVKHPLVNVMVDIEMTRSLVYYAAAAIDHEPENAPRLARMAKALASDTYANAVARAVQLHGGIGFTWECDVHLFFKRAQWSKFAFGDAPYHRRAIAEMAIGA
jgi:alkylation response protein AidB-like acyl-CoA dehydrogenase